MTKFVSLIIFLSFASAAQAKSSVKVNCVGSNAVTGLNSYSLEANLDLVNSDGVQVASGKVKINGKKEISVSGPYHAKEAHLSNGSGSVLTLRLVDAHSSIDGEAYFLECVFSE